MSEFKKLGDKYVSEWNGSSGNPGTNISPYAHPADRGANANELIIIGPGTYNGGGYFQNSFEGDGFVVLDCQRAGSLTVTSSPTKKLKNLWLKNFISVNFPISAVLEELIFSDDDPTYVLSLNRYVTGSGLSLKGGIFLCKTTFGVNIYTLENCLIMNDSVLATPTFSASMGVSYSFLPKGKKMTAVSSSLANITSSLINGVITVSGTDYELKKLVDGTTRPDADPLIADIASIYANFYVNGNFASVDPKIIDPISRIVEPDSDLLKKSGTYGYIGGVRPGKVISVNSSDPDVTITTTDIDTSDSQNWIIQSPATEGFINIVWKISDTIAEVQRIYFDALLQFDGSQAGGSTENNNVPDNYPASYSPLSQAGLKPNRLLYELRTSQSIAKPTLDSQWDNDNVVLGTTPGDFYLQEWNTKPTIFTVLGVPYGNGNPESIGGSSNGINARWGHAKIRLTNNRAY